MHQSECQHYASCGCFCETPREISHALCADCLEAHDADLAKLLPHISAPASTKYRLLTAGEKVCQGDESLQDDAQTWLAVPRLLWGIIYHHSIIQPVRRLIADAERAGCNTSPALL